ncbi:hypothetical protein [Fusobacterium ulcerans]|uniref:hypothetical protein n=1 Tax=Fusobacterium ulcerans TaxID=861 RepID=UPI0026E9A0D3|nr:hypothetical protein [Fusobacterium ulcerans]
MKKTFFMVGILAALSITAFGAEAAKEATASINITGTSVKALTLTASTNKVEFGKVMIGGSKTSSDVTLTLAGETGLKVKLTSDLPADSEVTFATGKEIINGTTSVTLAEGAGSYPIGFTYAPTKDADLNLTLVVTATYDDADLN